jgi:hypothetical protein
VSEEVQGQPAAEPSIEELAASAAKGMLESEEGVQFDQPRDDKGKFAPKAKAEAPAEEAPAEEAKAEEAPAEEPAEEQTEEEIQAEIRRHKLTVKAEDGSDLEVEVDDEELKKGYMLEKAFRMKTAQLAREKEAVQAKIKEAIEPKLKEYDEKLQIAEQAIWHSLAPEIKNIDWNKLAAENPAEWAMKYQQVQNINAQLTHIQAERKRVAEEQAQERQTALRKQAEEAVEILKTEIPGWSNDLYGKILKFGTEVGFKEEEVNAITDHRAIKVLHDAMQFRALKAKPIVEKRAAPAAPKVVKPGAGEKPDAGAEQWDKGMARLQKSGHTNDAVAVAKLLLAREARQK